MQKSGAVATATWDTVVSLEHAVKYFDQRRPVGLLKHEIHRIRALDDVSFEIRRGEFVAYAGPNGAGKSTTFKLLCGMLAPQSGNVRTFDMDPTEKRIPIMRKTGVLFGNRSELWWDHPVLTSFEWKKNVWAVSEDTYRRMLARVTELLDIGPFLHTFARELSLGQRMRANLALMLLHSPELILLDEPTLGLDVLAKRQMIDFLRQINREEGVTILVTSHDMDDLHEMANRIMLINNGKIAFDGNYAELLRKTGDKRTIRLFVPGEAPEIEGARVVGKEDGCYLYEYDAAAVPVAVLMRRIAEIPGVSDVETGHAPIESVIAGLYRSWAVH